MRVFKFLFVALMVALLWSLPAFAGTTDTSTIDITVNDTFYVATTAGADWTDTVVEADFLANTMNSGNMADCLSVAGNAAYEITAQMSVATWDGAVTLGVNVEAAGNTTLNDSTATVITGLDAEAAGEQLDLDLVWTIDGIDWDNTATGDDWTCTVTFTSQADT